MNITTKYNKGDLAWFVSYRLKKPIRTEILAIEATVTDKVRIRYKISPDGVNSYFYEWQLFETKEIAILNSAIELQ